MKKLISLMIIGTAGLLSTTVFADIIPFKTLTQAEQNCPAITTLTFTANNSKIPHSAGTITSNFNNIGFKNNGTQYVPEPLHLDGNDIIQDAQFRLDNGMYGYNSNNVISCFYGYTSFTGVSYNLLMRSV